VIQSWDPRRFAELDALLQQALDLDGDAREAFLDGLADQRPQAAVRLRAMLTAAEVDDDFLKRLLGARVWSALADDAAAGQQFGAWRARGTLAHGGMARVLYAERADGGFEQIAAIKCLWPGLATRELIARFEQERQILARLDDSRIARLLDGGVRTDGVPWLALEYVAGQPIDVYCDASRLDLDARLALWDEVAAAVSSAHRQLVVHRDLKPGNVLVRHDGAVKLLDFGIAKLLDPEGFPHAAPATQADARVLTRDYASPEQLRGEPVTTASDVYQLGLLVYELATGVQPFRIAGVSAAERERHILEEEPPLASGAFARGADAEQCAMRRSATVATLARQLRGDLDAILQRALAKLPAQRYASVDSLREDIARWRAQLPVHARGSSVAARAGKWLRRHRLLAAGGAALAALCIVYAITAVLQSRALAREAAVNRAVRDYIVAWFQTADPGGTAGRDPRASEMLAAGADKARRELTAQPELKAQILSIVGEVYMARGDYARAEPLLREAHDVYAQLPVIDPQHRGAIDGSLATLMHYTGRYAESETLYRQALDQRIAAIGEHGYWTLVARQYFADLLHSRGRYAEAIGELERAVAGAYATIGEQAPLSAALQRNLAEVYRDSGRQAEAEALYVKALATQTVAHGEEHPNTAATRLGLGRLRLEQGRYEEAAVQIEPAFAAYRQVKGDISPGTAYWERLIAELDESRGNLDAAETRLRRVDEAMRRQLPDGHLLFGYFALDRGFVALAQGRSVQAREQFAIAGRAFDDVQPEGHPRVVEVRLGQALIARRDGDQAAAQRLLAAAQEQASRQLVAAHPLFAAIAAAHGTDEAATSGGLAMLRVRRALHAVETGRQGELGYPAAR
jgi:tetratricopeptide (TPR) repeat protein/tRNA A-37 threonylcarbamoyl transferase component Bud32